MKVNDIIKVGKNKFEVYDIEFYRLNYGQITLHLVDEGYEHVATVKMGDTVELDTGEVIEVEGVYYGEHIQFIEFHAISHGARPMGGLFTKFYGKYDTVELNDHTWLDLHKYYDCQRTTKR